MNLRLAAAGVVLLLVSLASESSAVPTRVDFAGQVTSSVYGPPTGSGDSLLTVGSAVTGVAFFDPEQLPLLAPGQIGGLIRLQAGSETLETQIYGQPAQEVLNPPPGATQWRLTSNDSHGCVCSAFRYSDILIFRSTGTELDIVENRVIPPYLYGPPVLLSTVTITQWSNSLAAPEPGLVPLTGLALLLAARGAARRR